MRFMIKEGRNKGGKGLDQNEFRVLDWNLRYWCVFMIYDIDRKIEIDNQIQVFMGVWVCIRVEIYI